MVRFMTQTPKSYFSLNRQRPTGLVEGNRFDTSVAVEVIASRFFDHMPYYRQQDQFASCGWTPTC
jgi:hypothetical protein